MPCYSYDGCIHANFLLLAVHYCISFVINLTSFFQQVMETVLFVFVDVGGIFKSNCEVSLGPCPCPHTIVLTNDFMQMQPL